MITPMLNTGGGTAKYLLFEVLSLKEFMCLLLGHDVPHIAHVPRVETKEVLLLYTNRFVCWNSSYPIWVHSHKLYLLFILCYWILSWKKFQFTPHCTEFVCTWSQNPCTETRLKISFKIFKEKPRRRTDAFASSVAFLLLENINAISGLSCAQPSWLYLPAISCINNACNCDICLTTCQSRHHPLPSCILCTQSD